MFIDFSKLKYTFSSKPLVIGGKVMEYYGLRKSGDDIDLVVTREDLEEIIKKHPNNLKDLYGDFGVAVHGFEIWKTIRYFDYDFYSAGAVEEQEFLIISLEKLLFQKVLAMKEPKYQKDLELIVKRISDTQNKKFAVIRNENEMLISNLDTYSFVEKKP